MVAARKLNQKQLIEVHLVHRFEGEYPDVPISPNIDFEGLVAPDREAGEDPFFITLPLGERNQVSANGRRYVEDVAINAIHEAIQATTTGQLGHTAQERRGWEFKIPVAYWVGSFVDESGVVWGKAYIPRTQTELREYYRIQKTLKAKVGTSLEGMGYQEWNEDTEMWDILELDVHRIDIVAPYGVGIKKAGSMPPKITSETNKHVQEAEPDEIEVGDLVSWENRNNQLMRGEVNTVWSEGEVEVPYSDSPALEATAENPIARMDVFEPHYDTGEWRRVSWQEIQYVRDLTKIEMLPELKQEDDSGLSEGQADNNDSDLPNIEEKNHMGEKQETPETTDRIAELQETHQAELTAVQAQLQEAQSKLRTADATLMNVGKALGIEEGTDVLETVQDIVRERDAMKTEMSALLETAIETEIAKQAKIIGEALNAENADVVAFAETVRMMVRTQVQAESISKKAEIEPTVKKVVQAENIQSMLKALRVSAMGPNVVNPLDEADTPDPDTEVVTY